MADRTCSVYGCVRRLAYPTAGLCKVHYEQQRRPLRAPATKPCLVDGCDHPALARRMCNMHYIRWQKHGDTAVMLSPKGFCSVEGCGRPRHRRSTGLCDTHGGRLARNGDPAKLVRAPLGTGFVTVHGYRLAGRRGHPLATKQGYVLEHRVVHYDQIGPGEHPCHWCGVLVTWDVRTPGDPRFLTVDHLNFDKLDNRSENLVTSCSPCNVRRRRPPRQGGSV